MVWCVRVCVCESVWKNKYLKLKYLHTLEHCLHNNTERQGQQKGAGTKWKAAKWSSSTDKVCRDLCREKRKIEGSKEREGEWAGGSKLCVIVQRNWSCNPPVVALDQGKFIITQDSKRRRRMAALCVCVCTGEVCRGRQKIKRNEASTHTHRDKAHKDVGNCACCK